MEGIAKLKSRNIAVKINTVVVPEINVGHVPSIAQKIACLGADVMNCVPMIPVPGTPFGHLKAMTADEMANVRKEASKYLPQMRHCSQCRADAAGEVSRNSRR
jgi:nitrogen fixation protein NifB